MDTNGGGSLSAPFVVTYVKHMAYTYSAESIYMLVQTSTPQTFLG